MEWLSAFEGRAWARAEYGAAHRRREEITQRMISMRAEHDEAGSAALHLVEQHLGGRGG